jgi:8-oxo-dGTP pyrophosphatase MutT (NUDIX family)
MATLVERLRGVLDPLDTVHEQPSSARRAAAVLLLFDTRNHGLPLLFLERTAHLRHHAGQIAFPGGGSEPGDATVVETALREAREEAGIPATAVEVIGLLPPFLTATSDNWLTPVVGLQEHDVALRGEPFEVDHLFHVELTALISASHTVRTLSHKGVSRKVHFYDVEDRVIWGVTGAIIAELLDRLAA